MRSHPRLAGRRGGAPVRHGTRTPRKRRRGHKQGVDGRRNADRGGRYVTASHWIEHARSRSGEIRTGRDLGSSSSVVWQRGGDGHARWRVAASRQLWAKAQSVRRQLEPRRQHGRRPAASCSKLATGPGERWIQSVAGLSASLLLMSVPVQSSNWLCIPAKTLVLFHPKVPSKHDSMSCSLAKERDSHDSLRKQ